LSRKAAILQVARRQPERGLALPQPCGADCTL